MQTETAAQSAYFQQILMRARRQTAPVMARCTGCGEKRSPMDLRRDGCAYCTVQADVLHHTCTVCKQGPTAEKGMLLLGSQETPTGRPGHRGCTIA